MDDDGDLTRWVTAWAQRYPAQYDKVLAPLHGAAALDRSALLMVIDWKFGNMAHRRARARAGLAQERDQAILDITAAARACVDDGAAMSVIQAISRVGPALGSALLMTMDPLRWTVLDGRAVKSIRAIGHNDVPPGSQDRSTWLPYLFACRAVSDRTGKSLRDVDRALYQANGDPDLPRDETASATGRDQLPEVTDVDEPRRTQRAELTNEGSRPGR
ncbi:hypothetical protein [Micromonospora sp. S4605]|uniref:hypothetical protein n=1 Tax=Micromonospora sp. S4605 TaxID=1420897 RepID=UPI0011B6F364|nr:hypothetical protein [Micromonospora sp. S4605]